MKKTFVELDKETAFAIIPSLEHYMRLRTKLVSDAVRKRLDPVLSGQSVEVGDVLYAIREVINSEELLLSRVEHFRDNCLRIVKGTDMDIALAEEESASTEEKA